MSGFWVMKHKMSSKYYNISKNFRINFNMPIVPAMEHIIIIGTNKNFIIIYSYFRKNTQHMLLLVTDQI